MLAHLLKRFEPFTNLDDRALAMASKHASLIELPSNRWLLRRGRRLDRTLYLLEGALKARYTVPATISPSRLAPSRVSCLSM